MEDILKHFIFFHLSTQVMATKFGMAPASGLWRCAEPTPTLTDQVTTDQWRTTVHERAAPAFEPGSYCAEDTRPTH